MTDKLPKTFQHCIRCDKDVTYGDTHTCTPSRRYRAGMNEGELIQQKLNAELQAKYEKAVAFIKQLADESVYERYENLNEMNWSAFELLKELE